MPADRVSERLASRWTYFQQFLRSPGTIGAVTPSSQALARAMTDQVDFSSARVVVEYGPGTGVFTHELLRRLRPDGHLVVVELHPDFHARLVNTFDDPRVHLVLGSATDIADHLRALGIQQADAVVSALPFANMPAGVRDEILSATRAVLAPGAPFVAVQYLPFALPPLLRRHFQHARIATYCPANLPPAFVMVAADAPPRAQRSTLREARTILLAAAAIVIGIGLFRRRWGALAALAIPAILALYRDPHRAPLEPPAPNAILSPGEGTVLRVGPGRDSRGEECLELRIFLALWDVHVQRAPLAGQVESIVEEPGGFLPAFLAGAGDTNQRTTIRLRTDRFTCEVVQVAGILARRIVCWVREGDRVAAGERLGMIKFGSQVVLRLPPNSVVLVHEGQHVLVGQDLVALAPPD